MGLLTRLFNKENDKLDFQDYRQSGFLKKRILFLEGTIGDYIGVKEIKKHLLYLDSLNHKEITIYIDSPGGYVTNGLAIYDMMQYIKSPVSTICIGMAASMAAILLCGGAKEKRFAFPNSEIMIHQPSGGSWGDISDMEIFSNQMLKIRDKMNRIMANATGQSIDRIVKDTERDYYMTAEEAKEYGLIDDIVSNK